MFGILRHIIGLIILLMVIALGALAMPMASTAPHQVDFFPQQEAAVAEHRNVHFAARAPPIIGVNITFTGVAVAEQGNGFIMHAHETHVASLGFAVGLDAPNSATIGGKTCVYSCEVGGVTRYVGITDDIVKRGQAHMREKGIAIRRIPGLSNLSRADARAVEQTLINYHGLGKNGGTLINKINSISAVKNPTRYEQSLVRGAELLRQHKYPGF